MKKDTSIWFIEHFNKNELDVLIPLLMYNIDKISFNNESFYDFESMSLSECTEFLLFSALNCLLLLTK